MAWFEYENLNPPVCDRIPWQTFVMFDDHTPSSLAACVIELYKVPFVKHTTGVDIFILASSVCFFPVKAFDIFIRHS